MSSHHICYVANSSLGMVGMIDASECPPTCGSGLYQIGQLISQSFVCFISVDYVLEYKRCDIHSTTDRRVFSFKTRFFNLAF